MKKSFLIIGMGRFAHYVCEELLRLGNTNIMCVDIQEERVADLIDKVESVQIGDCTDPDVLRSLGVRNFDVVLICIGGNFQNSLEITWQVKQMGAKHVISKANRDMHADFLARNGADEVIYPDRDIAERKAKAWSASSIFDYIELDDGYSIYEIAVPDSWIGRSLRQLDIRSRYSMNVVGIKQKDKLNIIPPVDYPFAASDRLVIVSADKAMENLLNVELGDDSKKPRIWKYGNKSI